MPNTHNERLLKLVQGDKNTIQELYDLTFPKIVNYVLKNKGKQEDAEDVFQKGLMQVIARYKTSAFIIESSFDGFLYVVCRNLWLRELKKRKKVVTNDRVVELTREEDDMTMATLEQEKWELFQEKLLEISEKCRQLLQLFFKKVPHKEIASILGYNSDNVVRQRIFNCKSQLTKAIQSDNRFYQINV